MSYQVEFTRPADKQLKALPVNVQERLQPKIASLAQEPRPIGSAKLQGNDDLYRIRVGTYRIIYKIQDDLLLVLVVTVRHRRDVYR
ncbi:type II toxin-antitoxin system RelE family toxin [Phormidesmis priestleyi]